ncbi:protein of unknown function [Cryptosporangium aurantiacum]|uniref:DUF4307 domain-containing protein n=1 Tax=Cryptosporangium aurantiacum TaxID=134849 RepID=A0A1M7QSQ5_9ACTN|nr:protein of unknown function [Cryptosporangium aurantiacum]
MVGGFGVAGKLYTTYGDDHVESRVLRYSVTSDRAVRIEVEVSGPRDTPLKCAVRSRAEDGSEVGRTEISVPEGDSVVTQIVILPTTQRAVSGETAGCVPA